ncbi:MAG: S49 family peptidase, partial [Pseudomonadota bacterium]|nr:S49 family peptidase [Pseudomonadota bacterium]
LDKLGIERRLLTAGEHKGFLDPFSPMAAEDAEHIKTLLENVHQQFIQAVEAGRGERLNSEQKEQLFSGLIWTGEQAVELGLVDALGSSSYVAREIFKAEKIKDFTRRPSYLDRFAERLGATLATTLTQHLERTMLQ